MSLHRSFHVPSVIAQRSHKGQLHASARKKENKRRRERALQAEAKRRGVHSIVIYLEGIAAMRDQLQRKEDFRQLEQEVWEEEDRRWRERNRRAAGFR